MESITKDAGEPSPLSTEEVRQHRQKVPAWEVTGDKLTREYAFKDFVDAMRFVNRIVDLAEELQHHPDIRISYNKVGLELTTHKVRALTRKDFVLAGRIDHLVEH